MDPRLRLRIDLLVFLVSGLLGLVAVVGLLFANLAYAVVDRQTPDAAAT